MFQLTAKFNIQLEHGSLLICRDLSEALHYKAKIEDFEVDLCPNPDFQSYRNYYEQMKSESSKDLYFGLSNIVILVTGQEEVEPPPIRILNGITSYEERRLNFNERRLTYKVIAWTALDRMICYFKYNLHNPLLSTPRKNLNGLENPTWIDNKGQEIKQTGSFFSLTALPHPSIFGIKRFSANDDIYLEQALEKPIKPELYEELLADAQTAIFEGNLRRGSLEMAIATEVAVKQVFFAKSSVAGEVYEYLESKQKIAISITELIDGAARQAFGDSFKDANPHAFENIKYLFECRNKIAHRGEAWFRDHNKMGTRHELDRETLAGWWNAIEDLLNWLNNCTQKLNSRTNASSITKSPDSSSAVRI